MSQRAQTAIATHLCKGVPCEHHMGQGALFLKMVEDAQRLDREERAKEALDRIVERYQQKIR